MGDSAFEGSMSFVPGTTGSSVTKYEVHGVEKTDGEPDVSWSGEGTPVNYLIKVKRTSVVGIVEALDADAGTKKDHLEYDILFETGFQRGKVVIHKVASSTDGKAHRSEVGTGIVEIKPEVWEAGELIVFTKEKIDDLSQIGVQPGHEIDFLKGYLHVGLKAGVRELSDTERSGWMRGADEDFRAAHSANPVEPCWVEVTSSGTKAVAKDFGHDLNDAGT